MLPKVFIASSGEKGKFLAEAFVQCFNGKSCEFYPWWDDNVLPSGRTAINEIVNLCRLKMDYGLIFFTSDTVLKDSEKEDSISVGNSVSKNCFIEWGISVGALGLERTMCFTTVKPDYFPFDIRSIKHKEFKEPKIDYDSANRDEKIKLFINENKPLLNELFSSLRSFLDTNKKFYLNRPLLEVISQEVLLEFEQLEGVNCDGILKQNSRVEVALREPIESNDIQIAGKIVNNCQSNIDYHYSYTISEETQNIISNTFCTLLTTLELDEKISSQARIKAYKEFISRLKRRITLYFSFDPFEFEYCMHNNIIKDTVVYLKLNKNNNVYYTKFYDSDNKIEISALKRSLQGFKEKFKRPSGNSFFVALNEDYVDVSLRKKYSEFVEDLRAQISNKLSEENYHEDVISCLIQMPD